MSVHNVLSYSDSNSEQQYVYGESTWHIKAAETNTHGIQQPKSK